jgi:hypothetical protein
MLNMNSFDNMMYNNTMYNYDNDIREIYFEYDGDVQKIKCLYDEIVLSIIKRYCTKNNLNKDSLSFYFDSKILPNDNSTAFEIGLFNLSTIKVKNNLNLNVINPLDNNNNFNLSNNLGNLNLNSDSLNPINLSIDNKNNNENSIANSNDNDNSIINSNSNDNEKKINLIFNYKGKKEVVILGENSSVGDGLKAFLEKKNIDEDDYEYFTFVYDDKNIFLDDKRKLKDVFFGVHAQINVLGKQL